MTAHLGVDLGGTNFRIAAFGAGLAPESVHKEEVGEPRDPQTIVERLATAAERLAPSGPVTLGVGIAAMLRDRRGTVANSPHLRWRDVAFGELLAKRLGARFSVGVYNDVNAIVWGEAVGGAARGCRDVLGVYVGTGIGGGVIAGGQLVEGVSIAPARSGTRRSAGTTTRPRARAASAAASRRTSAGHVAKRIAAELAAGARSKAIELAGGLEHVTPGHVDQAAGEGDEYALALWGELAPLLAVTLANALAVLNSERLVLGGGLLGRTPVLYELVETALFVATPVAIGERLSVVPAELGDDAGLVGAAALARDGVSVIG